MRFLILLSIFLFNAASAENLSEIVNYHPIDTDLITAGQVLPEHVPALTEEQVGLVINLATASEERNGREGFLLTSEGISYIQIPVKWDEPTRAELELFYAVMDARGDRKTLVHCFANFRASAFTYLYRVKRLGIDEQTARADLEVVWTEEAFTEHPQWETFIDNELKR